MMDTGDLVAGNQPMMELPAEQPIPEQMPPMEGQM
jgi:hypothetical protein